MSYRFAIFALFALALAASPAPARASDVARHVVPAPRPATQPRGAVRPSLTDIPDLSKAVPADQINKLPTTEERYRTLKQQVDKEQPSVESARKKSEALKAETEALRQQLIRTATRVQNLEQEKTQLDAQIAELSAQEHIMSRDFARDRIAVAHLLGLLERLQHDVPPVFALTADDALGAAHRAMLLGSSLPRIYGEAARLATRLDRLRRTRSELVTRRAEGARNAAQLKVARAQLDQLLAIKRGEADTASARYDSLAARFAVISKQAADLGQLLQKVAALRAQKPSARHIVVVGSISGTADGRLKAGSLRRPVVGRFTGGGIDGVGGSRAPGITFATPTRAQVVAPADSEVLFAGPYHKTGQVLILEMSDGYDLVLAGLDRVEVKVGDQLLAGEPLGTMPRDRDGAKLYFELRHNGKGMSPVPWLEAGLRKAKRS